MTTEPRYQDLTSFWNKNRAANVLAAQAKLDALVPDEGPVPNAHLSPELERWRIMSNIYYEIYNNGGANKKNYVYELHCITGGDVKWKDICAPYREDTSRAQFIRLELLATEVFRAACLEQNIEWTA